METKMVLFDLDGTLLPMDFDVFVRAYFQLLAKKLAPHGYDPKKLVDCIWSGTEAMITNDGSCTNEEAFWKKFQGFYTTDVMKDEPLFAEYYRTDFQQVKEFCGYDPNAKEIIALVKACGYRTALATNPIFPSVATESRIRWAGLEPEDFEYFTTYENSCYSKPNTAYYTELIEKLGVKPEECVMVGNDTSDDLPAAAMGMKVFILTDCLINKKNVDLSKYPHGGFDELKAFIKNKFEI